MEKKCIELEISHLDSLGQGVAKKDGEIYFIKKTLPGERVIASFLAKSKGVHFYKLNEIAEQSPARQNPECLHFKECGGCDFLHIKYDDEIKIKKDQFERLFQKVQRTTQEVIIHIAPRRYSYRNRIQLHYNKKDKVIGLLNLDRQIFNLISCPVANELVNSQINQLMEKQKWLEYVKNGPNSGHIEVYNQKFSVNKPYADGGFTQVFEEMNDVLKSIVMLEANKLDTKNTVVDLFGGNGNLSTNLSFHKKWIIDFYSKVPQSSDKMIFSHQDIYSNDAINALSKLKTKLRLPDVDLLIIDPPRSGLKNLKEFIQLFFPKKIIYVSCQATSLIRDIKELPASFEISNLHLVDLFPGTHHYETVLIINRKDC